MQFRELSRSAEHWLLRTHRRAGTRGLVIQTTVICVVVAELIVFATVLSTTPEDIVQASITALFMSAFIASVAVLIFSRLIETIDTARAELAHQASHDDLTGVLNRRGFFDVGQQIVADAPAEHHLYVAMVDVDQFKRINDSFGHHVGDMVLAKLAANLDAAVFGRGAVGRLGGDEFAVIASLPRRSATRLTGAIAEASNFAVGDCHVAATVGHAILSQGVDLDIALRTADQDLYGNKNRAAIRA